MRGDMKLFPEIARSNFTAGQNGGMGGQSSATFEIYGYDFEDTDKVAQELAAKFKESDLFTQVTISRNDYLPEYQVEFDREKLAMHGLNLSTAATYIRNRYNGAMASYFREDGDEYDIKVRYEIEARQTLEDIENIIVYNNQGRPVRIKELGKVVQSSSPPTIERKDRERIVTVDGVLAAGAVLSDGVEYGKRAIEEIEIPSGIAVQVAGSYEDQQDSNKDLGQLAVIILVLVFIVMASQFESLTYPFILMFSVLFALSGVLIGLFITGSNLNIMSLLGGIMLIGMVVKNGIVLIDYIMLLRERGLGIIASCVAAAKSRLRPVLMTTCTTILGMIPMSISTGVGAEMWRPLGVAVIGGLTISTIMTLTYTPVMFCIFGGTGIKRKRKELKAKRELLAYWNEHKNEEMLISAKK
jgi:HAE1 family hydrophobic/amphiphilic exporter-1